MNDENLGTDLLDLFDAAESNRITSLTAESSISITYYHVQAITSKVTWYLQSIPTPLECTYNLKLM